MTRKRMLFLIVTIALLAVAFYFWGSTYTPPGQPPLVSLSDANLVDFQHSFNAVAVDTRTVLLLSPT